MSPDTESHMYNFRQRHGQAGGTKTAKPKTKKAAKVQKVMHEFKTGELHSGSKAGPTVQNRSQAIAIALSEARKAAK